VLFDYISSLPSWICYQTFALIFQMSMENFPNLKQNLTQTRCSWISDILKQQKNRHTHQTLVYSSKHNTKPKQDRMMLLVSNDSWRSPLACATCMIVLHGCILLPLASRYKSGRVLDFSTISFHLRRSWTCSVHFMSFIFFRSFLTSSSHRDLSLPTGLPVNGARLSRRAI